jgi:hypothetical protein
MFENADVIHSYTRAGAIRDGVLLDVSATANEAGFKYPVALTAAAWAKCVAVPPGVLCQDEAGRLWDLLWQLARAVRRGNGGRGTRIGARVRNNNREPRRSGSERPGTRVAPRCAPPGRRSRAWRTREDLTGMDREIKAVCRSSARWALRRARACRGDRSAQHAAR